jgi:hypothetical protein
MALSQRLNTPTTSSSSDSALSSENLLETSSTPGTIADTESETSPSTEKRKPLLFEPEPTQRMVVVRRRKRRRSKKIDKAEQAASRVRFVLFGLVVILLLVAVSGQHFAQALLEQLKSIARPVKGMIHVPKLEVIALVIAALILLYMMPGVESTVKRWLGISNRPKQKTR